MRVRPLARVDYRDSGDDTTGEVGVLFPFINDRFGLGAAYELGDADIPRGYVRWSFGR